MPTLTRFPVTPYQRARLQVLAWCEGRPYHDPVTDECTPDFGCCHPDLLIPIPERWAYYRTHYGVTNDNNKPAAQ